MLGEVRVGFADNADNRLVFAFGDVRLHVVLLYNADDFLNPLFPGLAGHNHDHFYIHSHVLFHFNAYTLLSFYAFNR
jgi:hypothetical protein